MKVRHVKLDGQIRNLSLPLDCFERGIMRRLRRAAWTSVVRVPSATQRPVTGQVTALRICGTHFTFSGVDRF
jgi:hypothetical protein